VIGHPSGNLLSLTLGVRPAPPFFLRIHSTRSSARVFSAKRRVLGFLFLSSPFYLHSSLVTIDYSSQSTENRAFALAFTSHAGCMLQNPVGESGKR